MPAVNTYRTLNDYRLSPTDESIYENGSHSKLGAGVLVAAIFIGIGAYFFYPMFQQRDAKPAFDETHYQTPAATESAAPDNGPAMDSAAMPDVPNTAAPSPVIPPTDVETTRTPAQAPAMNRTTAESKPNAAPAQRTKPASKPSSNATRAVAPASAGDTMATPDMTKPAPIMSPRPATTDHATDSADPMATHSDVPTDAPVATAPDATTP